MNSVSSLEHFSRALSTCDSSQGLMLAQTEDFPVYLHPDIETDTASEAQCNSPSISEDHAHSQFTSEAFTSYLKSNNIKVSQDGKGRVFNNIFVERLWRSVKYEEVYLKDYLTVPAAIQGLGQYFEFYNHQRLHQALNYQCSSSCILQ